MIGITALKMSKNNVAYPIDLFPVLKAFVAPIFPEPIFLMSFLTKNLVNIYPKGIDPSKYEIKIINIKIIIRF